jgi:tetratricopeptide (TPR) repeat protein
MLVASRVIPLLAIIAVLAGCSASPEGRASLAAGRQAMTARSFREALGHFRAAVAQVPDSASAHQARGEAAEALGEFDEALEAYHAAARLAPSPDNRVRLGGLAARAGHFDLAAASLEDAEGPWQRHALVGTGVGAATLALCATQHWPQALRFWNICLPGGLSAGQAARAASRERVAGYRFEILLEAGRPDAALALARRRGWVHEDARYCEARDLPVSAETAALLAMLLQPQDADCLLAVGARAADDGLVRLGRLMLQDRVARSPSAQVREQAAWVLRYRLPATDPVKTAESLNVTGWRLQHSFRRPQDALEAYTRAVAADPAFSWPYHNIGRLYLEQDDVELARQWLTKALEVNPEHWRALLSLAVALHRAQRDDEALAAYSRAVAINPDHADTRASIGWILVKKGRDAEGLRELQAAVRLDPSLDRERRYLDSRRPRRP